MLRALVTDRNRSHRAEAVLLALLAVLPIAPYLVLVFHEGVPRFSLTGDFALLEQATRHVWKGDTLLGPYSRFRWHHPGPLFFFLVAPFQALYGEASTGLWVGTCVVNAAAGATLVATTRAWAGRALAIAALAVVLAWCAAFGNVTANPWNPLVIVLPLTTFLVAMALFARGESRAAIPAVFFGSLAFQNHVATVSTVAIAGLAGTIAYAVGSRRRLSRRCDRSALIVALALLVVVSLPPLIEQGRAAEGNLGLLARFFLRREAPLKPLGAALRDWAIASSWMPDRILEGALAEEGWIPLGMRWEPLPLSMSRTVRVLLIVRLGTALVAGLVAFRRRDRLGGALLAIGVVAEMTSILAIRAIVGDEFHYLVFWTTAASNAVWIGTLAVASRAIAARLPARWHTSRRGTVALLCIAMTASVATTSLQRRWLAKNPAVPWSFSAGAPMMREVYAALRERLERDGAVAVIHPEGAWDISHLMVLELEKDGLDVRVPEHERWNYFGIRGDSGLARPLHVWFSRPSVELPKEPCLELLASSGEIEMYGPSSDPTRCVTTHPRR